MVWSRFRVALAAVALLAPVALVATPAHAATSLTVDVARRFQTIEGLGVNVNAHSWQGGELRPALDRLVDELGAASFRVLIENSDWEATNDDQDPAHFNMAYYSGVYELAKFTDLWNTIGYLNGKGVTIALSAMGPLADWMGGSSLTVRQEAEWVEMMSSLIYYGRVVRGLDIEFFSPFNEPDWNGIEGPQVPADQLARVAHQLAVRLDNLGLSDVRFILPDTASASSGVAAYLPALQGDSYLMGKTAALGLHSYSGETGNADSVIKGSAFPALPFWMTEFSAWCSACDNGAPNPGDWGFARTTAQYMMNNVRQGAAGALVWEAYDSYYEHHGSWSYWGLLAYNKAVGTYSPRKSFHTMAQFMRFIPPGSVRVASLSSNGNVSVVAFHTPATGRVTLVGLNTSATAETLSGAVGGIDGLTTMTQFRTNANTNMADAGEVAVVGGRFSTTVPGDTLFTLTGIAGRDVTNPTVDLTAPKPGATVAGVTQLAATSSDDRGVARVEFAVDGDVVGSDSESPYELNWDARQVASGVHTITARAVDGAGNQATKVAEVTAIKDTTSPTLPTELTAAAQTEGTVQLTWQPASDNIAVADYRVSRDGVPIGNTTDLAYLDPAVTAGTHTYSVEARDGSDNVSQPSKSVTITVGAQTSATVEVSVTTHQAVPAASIVSPVFSTARAGVLLVAFASSDGPGDSAQSFSSVTGGGLTWRLRQRVNGQPGTAEVWTAVAPGTLSGVSVAATRSRGSYVGSLTVVGFSGAELATDGASAGASGASGAPEVKLTTTRAGSWVWAVGDDWDRAVARTVPSGQTLVDQYLASVGDTFWVQRLDSPTPAAGTSVTVNDTAPTTDRWNLAAIEVRAR